MLLNNKKIKTLLILTANTTGKCGNILKPYRMKNQRHSFILKLFIDQFAVIVNISLLARNGDALEEQHEQISNMNTEKEMS